MRALATCCDFQPGDYVYHSGIGLYATVLDDENTPVDRVAVAYPNDATTWYVKPYWLRLQVREEA